jgi:DNA mismatch repair protein MutS2
MVRAFALTPMGDERLARLAPASDAQKVAQLLAATTETTQYLAANALFPLRASAELPQILAALAIEGRALEPLRLVALAAFLDSVDEAKAAIRRAPGSFAHLEAATGAVASFETETTQVRDKIDQSGEVVDDASPELKLIRERLRKQRSRLRGTLESYLRGKDTAKYLQDLIVTERNGRYVLVVKSEHRTSIPGIVHGASTSGASLFLEPLSTVEINNDIVALQEQEVEQVRRILLALSDAFRARPAELARTIDAATDLDVLQARARFSDSVDGIEPALSDDGAFELQAARHPLLKSAVPVTVKIIPPATCLLITGPNTGGKTVALKTAGLLALMAQAGLRIPAADGSRLPVFRSLSPTSATNSRSTPA